jgi:8-oxo-dGTP diphosphatase
VVVVAAEPKAGDAMSEFREIREWTVGGALIRSGDGLVMVANRRRDGSVDWTPPGGVIDPGESVLEGLAREVFEETGLRVSGWTGLAYRVEVEAPGLGWLMRVEAWEAAVEGLGHDADDFVLDDPDGIVHDARHAPGEHVIELIESAPLWIRVPIGAWLRGECGAALADTAHFRFRLDGTDRASASVVRLT